MKKSGRKKLAARRLERASSLPQMDLLTVDGELRRLDLGGDDHDEEDNVSTLELSAASPENAATVKGHRTTQLWFSSTNTEHSDDGNRLKVSNMAIDKHGLQCCILFTR